MFGICMHAWLALFWPVHEHMRQKVANILARRPEVNEKGTLFSSTLKCTLDKGKANFQISSWLVTRKRGLTFHN